MEIGPITSIRPVPVVRPSRTNDDLSGVFSVEFRKQNQDETYTPSHQKASRGLEDEDDILVGADEADGLYSAAGGGKINIFA